MLKIEDVSISETPVEIQKYLEAIGQRCIHPIVDLSNYILFDIGQPIHTFDARKVSGQFKVRQARVDERLVLLGGEEVALKEGDVVIADAVDDRIIALAGVKGGEETKVDEDTKEVYIEIASFDSVSVRRTMRRTGCISDAALRFSQGFPPELIDYTAHRIAKLFRQYGSIVDSFDHQRIPLVQKRKAKVSTTDTNALLGTTYMQEGIAGVLDRLGFVYDYSSDQEQFVISIPVERPDIQDENDLIEEIGRIFGYDSVPSVAPAVGRFHSLWAQMRDKFLLKDDEVFMKRLSVLQALRKIRFSEVITASFCAKSEVCVAYPVARDKGCLRSSLRLGIEGALEQNAYNGELLGLDAVQIAEIGSVFTKNGEKVHIALGVREVLGRKKS